jgi:hypothetical protein
MGDKVLKTVPNDEAPTSDFHALNLSQHDQFVSLGSAQSKESCRLFNSQQETGVKANYRIYRSIGHHISLSGFDIEYRATRKELPPRMKATSQSEIATDLTLGDFRLVSIIFIFAL